MKNCEAYSNFISIRSDHRIAIPIIRLNLRSIVKQDKSNIYDWSILKDPKISKEYSKIVKCTYNNLNTESINTSTTETYEHFMKANEEAAALLYILK